MEKGTGEGSQGEIGTRYQRASKTFWRSRTEAWHLSYLPAYSTSLPYPGLLPNTFRDSIFSHISQKGTLSLRPLILISTAGRLLPQSRPPSALSPFLFSGVRAVSMGVIARGRTVIHSQLVSWPLAVGGLLRFRRLIDGCEQATSSL